MLDNMLDNKIKTWNTVKRETKNTSTRTDALSSYKRRKVKEPGKVADAFNNFFLTITENINIHRAGKEDAITLLKDSFPRKFPAIKFIPTTEPEIKV
jgi:hypothetical protein